MKNSVLKLISMGISTFAFLISNQATAKIIYYGSETETLSISNTTPTLIRFNEEVKTISQATKFIIEPTDAQDPSYQMLSIKPRFKGATDTINFILNNDMVVSLKIQTIPDDVPEQGDHFYDFRPKELKIDPLNTQGAGVTELELMKAMIRSDQVVGHELHKLTRTINTGVGSVSAKLIRVYTGPKFHGYVFELVNDSKVDMYAIDLKSLTFGTPNVAILSQSDEKILKPRAKAYLRVVTRPTSVYYAVNLPVAPIKNQE